MKRETTLRMASLERLVLAKRYGKKETSTAAVRRLAKANSCSQSDVRKVIVYEYLADLLNIIDGDVGFFDDEDEAQFAPHLSSGNNGLW